MSSSLFQESALPSSDPANVRVDRKSFVGTPCYMAPEIVQRKPYDTQADIWSLGITALELAAGRAPNALYAPAKVLSKTLLDAPPTLDREGNRHKYSRAFAEFVDQCLTKDPRQRPTAEKLLQHAWLRQSAKPKKFLVGAILEGLPPLENRQDRRRNPSTGGMDTVASGWDFSNGTLPASLRSFAGGLLAGSPSLNHSPTLGSPDPFANFSMSGSAPGSPTNGSFPRRMGSMGREREASVGSGRGRRHQRGVSFDLNEGQGAAATATHASETAIKEEAGEHREDRVEDEPGKVASEVEV